MNITAVEKFERFGVQSLSLSELLEIASGSKKTEALKYLLSCGDISEIEDKSILRKKHIRLFICIAELLRRKSIDDRKKITNTKDIVPYVHEYSDKKQEYFLTITLNGANEVIKVRVITIGLADRTQIHPREIFADAITDRACSIIAAHNHPSGSLIPSDEDIEITEKLKKAGELLGISLLDHVIFSQKGHMSIMGWL